MRFVSSAEMETMLGISHNTLMRVIKEKQIPVLPENLIHPAIVDFLIFGCGPWDDDFMAPNGPSDIPWHGSIPYLSCS